MRLEIALLISLDANIGAIYLSDVQSGFKYKDAINSTLAQQQSNGVFKRGWKRFRSCKLYKYSSIILKRLYYFIS